MKVVMIIMPRTRTETKQKQVGDGPDRVPDSREDKKSNRGGTRQAVH